MKMPIADRDKALKTLADMNELISYLHEEALSRLNKRVASINDPRHIHELLKEKLSLEKAYRKIRETWETWDDDELRWAIKGVDALFSDKCRGRTNRVTFVKLCDEIIKNEAKD